MSSILSYSGVILAGITATAVMSAFALSFSKVGLLSVNAIEAVGSSVSGRLHGARTTGLMLHGLAGVIFAFVYAFLLRMTNSTDGVWPMLTGAFIGAAHGYVVSFFVVISIGEHSHWARFRRSGIGISLVYLLAHIVYGVTLGSMFVALRVFSS